MPPSSKIINNYSPVLVNNNQISVMEGSKTVTKSSSNILYSKKKNKSNKDITFSEYVDTNLRPKQNRST